MEREPKFNYQKNWMHRYVILMSSIEDENNFSEQHKQFLQPIKEHYYQEFLNNIGNKIVPPDIEEAVKDNMSVLIDQITVSALNLDKLFKSQISKNLPAPVQSNMRQHTNFLTAELCRKREEIIVETVNSYSEDDNLRNTKVGRFIRKLIPSKQDKKINKIAEEAIKETDNQVKNFINEMRNKWG